MDPKGATDEDLKLTFDNWLKYVEDRSDLSALHKQRPFKQRFIQHPYQPNEDNSNCGVFVCKLLSLLLQDEPIHPDSFDPLNISTFRETILNSLAWTWSRIEVLFFHLFSC